MNHNVLRFMKAQGMVNPGDHVICAVSGGKDSMALLYLMLALRESLNITVSAAHFNHQLRGPEAQRDQDFVTAQCHALGIPLSVGSGDVRSYAEQNGLSLEDAARQLRYDFLLSIDPAAKIATAHTADDEIETVLMHLLRGSSLHGLTGIPPMRGRVIRPLLTVGGDDISAYLEEHQIPHVEDSSNESDDFLRNRIRRHVVPFLKAENPKLVETVTRLTKSLRLEDQFLEEITQTAMEGAVFDGILSLDAFFRQPEAIQYRMLRQFLSPVPQLSTKHLDAAMALCQSLAPSARCSLPGGYTLSRIYNGLLLRPPEPLRKAPAPVRLEPGIFAFGPWQVTCRTGLAPESRQKGTVALSAAAITEPLILRTRMPGDKITLHGGTKKLSRLLIDLKIPASMRDTLPVVSMGDTILAVLPLRAAESHRAKPGQQALLLTIKGMEETTCIETLTM